MIKVKKLEWVENVNKTYINSESRQFYILYPNHQSFLRQNTNYEAIETFFDGCKATKLIGNFKTLEQAKQACQDHYESFILSQVENVKDNLPKLIHNAFIENLGNGYSKIHPIDKKRVKPTAFDPDAQFDPNFMLD